MRRAARKDANQGEIVDGLRRAGVRVEILNQEDIPDLLVGYRFNFWLFEVKDGDKPPSRRKLRPGQQKFAERWAGYPIVKIESLDDAFSALGIKVQSERSQNEN
jgi:hypothetical protein